MGVAVPHVLGRNLAFFAKPESTFGTFIQPTATDALKVLKSSMTFKQGRKDRMDSRATRSRLERITGRKEVTWSLETYVLPSGAAGTKPDVCDLMKALMGVETVNAATSVVYSGSASQAALGSLSLVRQESNGFMEACLGAYVESLTAKGTGGGEPTLAFQGGAADIVTTGYSTTNGALSGGETSITVQTADITNFANGSVIKVGTSDGSGAGHLVTAGGGTASLTISPAISGAQGNGVAVVPFVPSQTTAGIPVAGILGTITVDAVAVPITAFDVTVKNNLRPVSDEAFTALVTDYIPGFREVTGNISLRVRRDLVVYLTKRATFATRNLVVTFGSTAGKKLQIDIPYAELDFSEVSIPESDEATCSIPFNALGSSGEDEITFTWK